MKAEDLQRSFVLVVLTLVVAAVVFLFVKDASCWGCFGGPCVTSAACVEGCHCMGDPGRCG